MKNLFARFMIGTFAILIALGLSIALASCNVTRRVTTESSYFTKGDTAITITTRTVESYDASKKLNN